MITKNELEKWSTEEITEDIRTLTITIPITKWALEKLIEYGYDFTSNLTDSLKRSYWAICEAEDEKSQ